MTIATAELSSAPFEEGKLQRSISWTGAFWVASGVPPLVLFSIGGIAGTTGTPAVAIWTASMLMGFLQSFVYAEMAGLFPNKSGGSSVYGAAAWIRYARPISPLLVWCNWIAWTPVLALGCTIAAAYILNALVPDPNAAIRTWTLAAGSLGAVSFSLNTAFFIGVALMLAAFAVQYRGISGTAQVQRVIGLAVIIPLLIIGVAPLLQHGVNWANFTPFVPLAEANKPALGSWNSTGWTLVLGGMFLAAWSTYAFETSICYTSEFKNPKTDTFKAIFYSGLLCLTIFLLVPFTFQSELGLSGMMDPSIADGSGVAAALARMVGGGANRCERAYYAHDLCASALFDDGDGRSLSHALSGFPRRLDAKVSRPGKPPRRTYSGDVDWTNRQPRPSGNRLCRLDFVLFHSRRVERWLRYL